jgi:hypothetical protein
MFKPVVNREAEWKQSFLTNQNVIAGSIGHQAADLKYQLLISTSVESK